MTNELFWNIIMKWWTYRVDVAARRVRSTPITEQAKQQEWNTICTIAKNNGFPIQLIHNLRNKINKKQHTTNISIQTTCKKRITFTFRSPLLHKITNLFRNTNLHIAFKTNNTIFHHFCYKSPNNTLNSSVIYKIQCNMCKKS